MVKYPINTHHKTTKEINMKKIILLLMAAITSACGTSTIIDVNRTAKIEDIIEYPKKEYKYKAIAWQYVPKIKKYIVYTDSLYAIGDLIEIK